MNEISVGASGDDNNIILHLVCCFRAGAAWWEILKADCVGFLLSTCMSLGFVRIRNY